jgi:hypothetical protein
MPIHDWTRVDAGIFHDFHHAWIEQLKRHLKDVVLPPDHYAMAEQHVSHFGPDVLTLQRRTSEGQDRADLEPVDDGSTQSGGSVLLAAPRARLTGETDLQFLPPQTERRRGATCQR